MIPVISILPVPSMLLLLRSKFPPSCGVVSSTTLNNPPVPATPVIPDPSPTNEVAVMIPVILTSPVPVISLLFRSKFPLKVVAVKIPLAELKVRFEPLLAARLPEAAVVNNTLQLVLVDSSSTTINVDDDARVALDAFPVRLPTNEVAVMIPVISILPVPSMLLPLRSKFPPNSGVVSSTRLKPIPLKY